MNSMDARFYRAKEIDHPKDWIEGVLVLFRGDPYIIEEDTLCGGFGNYLELNAIGVRVDPETLCRCTGMMDKNQRLIWENDIVNLHILRTSVEHEGDMEEQAVVCYDSMGMLSFKIGTLEGEPCYYTDILTQAKNAGIDFEIEVIGSTLDGLDSMKPRIYTGITDKNGNPVWDNSIVRDTTTGKEYRIIFDRGRRCYYAQDKLANNILFNSNFGKGVEVIGSILNETPGLFTRNDSPERVDGDVEIGDER